MKKIYLLILFFMAVDFFAVAQITMQKQEQGLLILEKGEEVLFYQTEPKNFNGKYERRHYIHPLWGMDGKVLTEDFPDDHLHHRGIFWAWHQVWIGDQRIGDPWELVDFEQQVPEVEFSSGENGRGILNTHVNWMSEKWKREGKKVPYLRENTTIIIHPKKKNYRKIDFEIRLQALEENLSIGGSEDEKGYGGFSVRMVLPDDVKFHGPIGEVEPQVIAVDSPGYVNVSGSIGRKGKNGGIVMLDHPENPDYPQPWILRKRRSMQNAAFPGREVIPVPVENPLVLKYSLLVYSGKINEKVLLD